MAINAKVERAGDVMAADDLIEKYRQELQKALDESAILVRDEADKLLSQEGRGIHWGIGSKKQATVAKMRSREIAGKTAGYTRKGKRRVGSKRMRYRSSAVGAPPAAQSGRGRKSVQIDRSQMSEGVVRVGTNVKYMAYHETHDRPWLSVAVENKRNEIIERFRSLQTAR